MVLKDLNLFSKNHFLATPFFISSKDMGTHLKCAVGNSLWKFPRAELKRKRKARVTVLRSNKPIMDS